MRAPDLDALLGPGDLAVLAPHPDDETLGCGALLAAAFEAGRRARVIVVTRGDKSHRNSARWPAERLAERRASEAIEAVRRLGGSKEDVAFLDYPDWGAPQSGMALTKAALRITDILDRLTTPALFATSGADPHADHKATAEIAREATRIRPGLRLFFYPIWSRDLDGSVDTSPDQRLHRFPVAPFASRKRHALDAHATQLGRVIDDDPDGFVLPPDFREMFLSRDEIYLEPCHALGDA